MIYDVMFGWLNYSKQQRLGGCGSRSVGDLADSSNRSSWPQFYQRTSNKSNNSINSGGVDKVDSKTSRRDSMSGSGALERVLCPSEAKVMQRASQIVMYVPAQTFLGNFRCWLIFKKKMYSSFSFFDFMFFCLFNIVACCMFFLKTTICVCLTYRLCAFIKSTLSKRGCTVFEIYLYNNLMKITC